MPRTRTLFRPEQRGYSQYDLPMKLHPNPEERAGRRGRQRQRRGRDAAERRRSASSRSRSTRASSRSAAVPRREAVLRSAVRGRERRRPQLLRHLTEKFDVIAFGLLDSHTTTAMTNARLDHYVYTRESLDAGAGTCSNPGGVDGAELRGAESRIIADRMGDRCSKQAFGHEPVVFRVPWNAYGWGGLLFVVGDTVEAAGTRIAADPKLAELDAGVAGRRAASELHRHDAATTMTGRTSISRSRAPPVLPRAVLCCSSVRRGNSAGGGRGGSGRRAQLRVGQGLHLGPHGDSYRPGIGHTPVAFRSRGSRLRLGRDDVRSGGERTDGAGPHQRADLNWPLSLPSGRPSARFH